jgi:hypothetical protein
MALPVASEEPLTGYLDSVCFCLHFYLVSTLNLLRSADQTQGTHLFLALLFCVFTLVFFFYGHYTGKSKERRIARRRQHSQLPCEGGKRSSVRVKLRNHELVFVERVEGQEFDRQKTEYTERQVAELQATNAY